jgi:transcriptional repressor NF-X1
MYVGDVAWAHKQEELLRLFAADTDEKRLRFPPMKKRQRTFIHSLAEDFGFDYQSLDPEPHRHVLVFKTPKFVAAPMKTLAQAARIKRAALNVSTPVASVSETRADEAHYNYNGFLLTRPRFALTEDELRPVLAKAAPATEFDIVFMPSDDALALLPSRSWETTEQLTTLLKNLQPALAVEVTRRSFASSVALCQFDITGSKPCVVHQQGKHDTVATKGWSQVAKKAAPIQAKGPQPVGQRSVYTILGSRLAEAKKKTENEKLRRKATEDVVVDDWELEVDEEEGATPDGVGKAAPVN